MKTVAKILGVLLLLVALCSIGLIAVVEIVSHRSQREVVFIVSQLSPGTPFSVVLQRLGQPKQALTNAEEIIAWVESVGGNVDPKVVANATLHTFVHKGPPFRYILVYTDTESQKVIYTDWCHM